MSLARRPWYLFLFFGLLVVATRWPALPGRLFGFDAVNLAYSIRHFDIRISQPQPPGYPLFVMEMRALRWVHIRRPESVLIALALLGAVAALTLTAMAGNRIFGGESGYYAAWLMAFDPAFWHTSLTSALRLQLAVVSAMVGWGCWRAWRGEGRWVLWSALALGIGAGIRPEAGPLLFPLWAVSALRAPISWRTRALSLLAMAGAVLAWLAPAMLACGGPAAFLGNCNVYLFDQASITSGLFGASQSKWAEAFWHLIAWTCCGVPGWPLAAVLAWQHGRGWDVGLERAAFAALWIGPAVVFAVAVHIADPGHALAILPVVVLFGGYLVDRAVNHTAVPASRWDGLTFAVLALAIAEFAARHNAEFSVVFTPLACLAVAFLLKREQVKNNGYPLRAYLAILLLAPTILLDQVIFYQKGWEYPGSSTPGRGAAAERALEDLSNGLALTSYGHIADKMALDNATLSQVIRLSREKPGATWVVWEEGPTTWRKIAYYAPKIPVVLLDHTAIRGGSPPIVVIWKGPKMIHQTRGAEPLAVTVPPRTRIVWVLSAETDFLNLTQRALPLEAAGPVWYTDLPGQDGARVLGEYEIRW